MKYKSYRTIPIVDYSEMLENEDYSGYNQEALEKMDEEDWKWYEEAKKAAEEYQKNKENEEK